MKAIRIVYSFISLSLLLSAQSALAIDYTWNGGTGDWSASSKWTPDGVPVDGDSATIGTGTVTISGTETVGTLNLQGGSITGAATLTVPGASPPFSISPARSSSPMVVTGH